MCNITYALLHWGNREKLEATLKDRERVVEGTLGNVFDVSHFSALNEIVERL